MSPQLNSEIDKNRLVIVPRPGEPLEFKEGEGLLNLIGYAIIPLEIYDALVIKSKLSIAQVEKLS